MSQEKKPVVFVYSPGYEFVNPYLEAEFADYEVIYQLTDDVSADVAVMVSSTDIYDVVEGMNYDENTPVKSSSQLARDEEEFRTLCAAHGLKPTILRCANIIGTGMNGLPMRFARGIARGLLMNVKDNEAVLSTVHAVDVVRVAHALADKGEVYNVTNGINTAVPDLINALAYRIKNKQVFTLGTRWARLLYGNEYFSLMTTSLTFSNIRMVHALPADTELLDVVQYMKNHDYSNDNF
jgi:nucleoside-diphosphate-sugar epimerase